MDKYLQRPYDDIVNDLETLKNNVMFMKLKKNFKLEK